eukprot:GHVU01079454.1.p1 GENE.GHVU01079454.1~~GHVU01079454.1.p1  ORF type:complete len:120 (-),score=1.49 GHVU01079454.1:793-1152(-)
MVIIYFLTLLLTLGKLLPGVWENVETCHWQAANDPSMDGQGLQTSRCDVSTVIWRRTSDPCMQSGRLRLYICIFAVATADTNFFLSFLYLITPLLSSCTVVSSSPSSISPPLQCTSLTC